jgi:uncharacterized protein (TIGR03435 family)
MTVEKQRCAAPEIPKTIAAPKPRSIQPVACFAVLLLAGWITAFSANAQESFAVATIRPSAAAVKFESDGMTQTSPGAMRMMDVTVATCLKWAYGIQDKQISGPDWLQSDHFDINAKADGAASDEQMKRMMQSLLADRFKLSFHRQQKELKAFALTAPKGAVKLHEAPADGVSSRQNSANGTVAKSTTMREFADFISGPLRTPVVDETDLPGRYDFVLDFTTYLPDDMKTMREDATNILIAALQGELGLKLESRKTQVEVFAVDHIEKPSAN